jgi:hypothetical protein
MLNGLDGRRDAAVLRVMIMHCSHIPWAGIEMVFK